MRLFIGIEFPPDIVDGLCFLQGSLRSLTRAGRFPDRDNLHLTLHFLGEVKEEQVAEVKQKLEAVAIQHSPFPLALGERVGYFGQGQKLRVLWLGLQGDWSRLLYLQTKVAATMKNFGGTAEERAYKPHITLARDVIFSSHFDKMKNGWLDFSVSSFPTIQVKRFSLISSSLETGKRRYRPLETFLLRNAANNDKVMFVVMH